MQPVQIIWIDIDSNESWMNLADIKTWADETYRDYAETLGYIVLEEEKYIVVAASRIGDEWGEKVMIPKGNIVRINRVIITNKPL